MNNRVIKVAAGTSGNIVQTYIATGTALNGPEGLCLDSPANNVYVVDTQNQRVVKFTNAGVQSAVFPATGTTLNPALQYPWNCVIDSVGRVVVSNVVGQVITVISADGSTQLGAFSVAALYPNQIAIDTAGYLYIADSGDARISKVNISAGYISGASQTLPVMQNFSLPAGSFPNGVAVDTSFNVYATATAQNTIYVWSPSGTQTATLAMPSNTLPLNNPRGLAVDTSGNIYVTLTAHMLKSYSTRSEWHQPDPHCTFTHSYPLTRHHCCCHCVIQVADANNNRIVMFQKTGKNSASSVAQSASLAVIVLTALLSLALSL